MILKEYRICMPITVEEVGQNITFCHLMIIGNCSEEGVDNHKIAIDQPKGNAEKDLL